MSLTRTRRSRATGRTPSFVDPDRLYSRRGMLIATGLGEGKLHEIRSWGLECRRFWVGRRCFFKGSDIITFLELASLEECRRSATIVKSEEE